MLVRQRCGTLCPPSYPRAYPLHHHLFAARHRGGERHRQGRAAPCRRRSRDRGQASASWRRLERRMAGDMNDRVPVMLACGVILAALFAEAHPDFIAHPPRSALEMRSEEHTSELQSLMRSSYAVFCLKKKKSTDTQKSNINHT